MGKGIREERWKVGGTRRSVGALAKDGRATLSGFSCGGGGRGGGGGIGEVLYRQIGRGGDGGGRTFLFSFFFGRPSALGICTSTSLFPLLSPRVMSDFNRWSE